MNFRFRASPLRLRAFFWLRVSDFDFPAFSGDSVSGVRRRGLFIRHRGVCGRMKGMKRFRRVVVNGVTVLSLVLALLMVALWVRSHWASDWITIRDDDARVFRVLVTNPSYFEFIIRRSDSAADKAFWPSGIRYRSDTALSPGPPPHTFLGFGGERRVNPTLSMSLVAILYVPHWFFVALFSQLPAMRICRSLCRRKLTISGHCPVCGYDLRATPDRCPECGTVAGGGKART